MTFNNQKLVENVGNIFDELGVKFKKHNNRISFACPIHGGDKSDGCSLFTNGTKALGNWKCWTNHCEETHGQNIVNFVQAVLSIDRPEITTNDTVQWLEKVIGSSISIKYSPDDRQKYRFINLTDELSKSTEVDTGIKRGLIRQSLIYPAQYFIQRGFSQEILDKYDVGFCNSVGKPMFNRVVVPVYDDSHNFMVGCVGRTTEPQCEKCEKFHKIHVGCPISSYDEFKASKWINSKGFNAEKYLYNFWYAKDYINLTNTAILVEGQGDVWRLEEAGINIGLGLFGSSIKDSQILKLEQLSLINIIIASDSDLAGLKCKEQIIDRLSRSYNIIPVYLPKKDVGEMSTFEIQEFFNPIIEKYVHQLN